MNAMRERYFNRPLHRLLLKVCVIAMPMIVVVGVDVSLLPADYFTFRLWEAMWTNREMGTRFFLPGPFYPRMSVTKTETFDLASSLSDPIRTRVRWETDRFGYRKQSAAGRNYPIVIVGDSSTVGTGLDQPDTLSEVLEGMLGVGVYPYAVSSVTSFLHDIRFIDQPPRVVVLAVTERMIPSVAEIPMILANVGEQEKRLRRMLLRIQQVEWVQRAAISLDRALKLAPLHYARSRLVRDAPTPIKSPTQPRILFLQGEAALQPVPEGVLARCVSTLKGIKAVLGARGIRFVFLPIPNKEDIYYRMLGAKEQPIFLAALVRALRDEGIDAVDSQAVFNDAYTVGGEALYQTEDSHWNAAGVRLTAGRLAEVIRSTERNRGAR
jgi:hypothetical protein